MEKFYVPFSLSKKSKIQKVVTGFLILCICSFSSFAQCPPNIDYEQGNFNNWECFQGNFVPPGVVTGITLTGPISGRHDLITATSVPAVDQYGFFPRLCPNGSGTSIKIGNENTGTFVDRVVYTFTIPAGQNSFNLIYNYAIVINNSGGHLPELQPRLTVSVKNLTDNTEDSCSSFDIAYSNANPLPGFQDCSFNSNIKFKPWAANSIDLNGNAGKTIEVSFTVTGCGLTNGSHFGYAYIDVNSECSSSFIGATYCPDDAFINVVGPFGYQTYAWWDENFTTPLGNAQTINFTPPPAPGTILKLVVNPYNGYGCTDTLTATLQDTLTIQSVAGPDRLSCNGVPVQLGAIPKPAYIYSWSPPTNLSNPAIANPMANPPTTTQYILTTTHEGGGCVSRDTVMVFAATLDSSIQLIGLNTYCLGDPQGAVLRVQPADSIQWFRNNVAIPGATQTQYSPTQSGTYYAAIISFVGCVATTDEVVITVNETPVSGFLPDQVSQCLKNNLFAFTNTSTISAGALQYEWDFGDGNTSTTANATHSYTAAGTYQVRLIATAPNGCKDTSNVPVQVYDMPVVGFTVNLADQCFRGNQFVFTNTSTIAAGTMQYAWDLGDGATATTRDVTHSYASPGTYTVKLVVTSNHNCVEDTSFNVTAFPTPVAGFVLNSQGQQCFRNNQFVFANTSSVFAGSLQYRWEMGNGDLFTTRDISYSYPVPGTYTVKLVIVASNGGCMDSTLFDVTVYPTPAAGFSVNQAGQCFNNNQFIFTNNSTVFSGNMQYLWDFGDGTTATTQNATHSYAAPGTYPVKLLVTGTNGGCTDSIIRPAIVFAYPVADFLLNPLTCTNLPVYVVNKTINTTTTTLDYLWDFGNGQTSNLRTPVYSYPAPGNYKIRLTTNITGCPTPVSTRELDIRIEAPVPGITYPEFNARFNFPEVLNARNNIGNSVVWSPATYLDNRFIYRPTFRGLSSQLYTIELKNSSNGCVTVDTQLVKTLKKIEIYVPTVFTPGGDGLNDLLRPLLFGFDHVNYFRVYDRWGKLLFQMKSDRPGWDGKLNGQPAEMQTVVWMIEAVDVDGVLHRKHGTTVLIR
jgi:gliding motility-associated-like protein